MATQTIQADALSSKLLARWEQIGEKIYTLANEVPEEKYDYQPLNEVRTFADVLRHIAFWNRYVAESARGRKADDSANQLSKDEYRTKAKILKALKASTAETSAAFAEHRLGLSADLAELLLSFLEHNCEHYGQLVVYARLNQIVPPASRG